LNRYFDVDQLERAVSAREIIVWVDETKRAVGEVQGVVPVCLEICEVDLAASQTPERLCAGS